MLFVHCWFDSLIGDVDTDVCVLRLSLTCLTGVTSSDQNKAQLLVLGPTVMLLLGVKTVNGRPLEVGVVCIFVDIVSVLLVGLRCFIENIFGDGLLFECFADGSGLTDLLL